MSSLFATGDTRRNSPAYCKKGFRDGVPYWEGRTQKVVNVWGYWYEQTSGPLLAFSESFVAHRNAGNTAWAGSSSQTGWAIGLILTDLPTADFYEPRLLLYLDNVFQDQYVYPATQIPAPPDFDTGYLPVIIDPGYNERNLRVFS